MKALKKQDLQIYNIIKAEEKRLREVLQMIPSENYPSKAVLEALGSVLNFKYSEGYPKRRYYQGNVNADNAEITTQERAKKLFGVPYVNVQALSGSPANMAVYVALLQPKDKIMGLQLAFGGHLTHGAPNNFSSKFFTSVQYQLGNDGKLDYDEIEKLAIKEKPQIIVCGFTAYPRKIDFKRFGEIADKAGAYLLADISHIAGLVVGGVHMSPVQYAHIVTTTTHKTLRGPRGALIMVTEKGIKKNPDLPKLIDSAIIPGIQGGPHDNQTAAIGVTLKEAATASFKRYAGQIIKNNKILAEELLKYGFDVVSGGSDNHLMLIDFRNKGLNGKVVAFALEVAGIVTNMNGVPFDTMPPLYPSGIRLGTTAITSRGMKEKDMKKVAAWINRAVEEIKNEKLPEEKEKRSEFMKEFKVRAGKNKNLLKIGREVKSFSLKFPVPGLD